MVLAVESVFKTLVCDRSIESYWAILSWGTDYNAMQGVLTLTCKSVDETPMCDHSNDSRCIEQHFLIHLALFIMLYKVVVTFESVD